MRRRDILRLVAGIALSAALLALLIARVDLEQVGVALVDVAPAGLVLALVVVAVDLAIRALRWRTLLAGILPLGARPSLRLAAAYLTVGFLANGILPARLGDVARAYLAGAAFGASRLAVFGTILVERIGDGLTMVAFATLSSLAVVALVEVQVLAVEAVLLVVAGAIGLWLVWLALRRGPFARNRFGSALRRILTRVAAGAAGIRTLRGAIIVGGETLAAAGTASLVAWYVAGAMGLELGPGQVVLFTSGIALSLAIPAAPGSLGTYEFAGVLILTSFGATAERALATILVMRLVSTLPLIGAGFISTWVLHIRPATLLESSPGEILDVDPCSADPAAGEARDRRSDSATGTQPASTGR